MLVSLRMPLGDVTLDGWVDGEDLPEFALAWNRWHNTRDLDPDFDIGLAKGIVPNLVPDPDGRVDFEDVAVFIQMWNWSVDQRRGKTARLISSSPDKDSRMRWNEGRIPFFPPGKIIPLTLCLPDQSSVMVLHLEWTFDPGRLTWHGVDALETLKENADHVLVLSWVDETEGRVLIDVARLGGRPFGADGAQPLLQVSWSARTELSDEPLTILCRTWDGQGVVRISEQAVLKLSSRPSLPEAYGLHPPFPNPFNVRTVIRYDLPEVGEVRLTIYDMLGRVVRRLVEGRGISSCELG